VILVVYVHFKDSWTVVEASGNYKTSLHKFKALLEASGHFWNIFSSI